LSDKRRVLVVDDSSAIRAVVSAILAADPEIEVCGKASNGEEAVRLAEALLPDLVTLDVEMPGMDGIEALRALKRAQPRLPIVMLSSLTEKGAETTLDALAEGADDYVPKPSAAEGFEGIARKLPPLVKALCKKRRGDGRTGDTRPHAVVGVDSVAPPPRAEGAAPRVVVVAASTGGPDALKRFLQELPREFDVPIVVAVHMPPTFTRALSDRLAAATGRDVKEAIDGEIVPDGAVRVAPGSIHVVVEGTSAGVRTRHFDGPPEHSCKPAADPLFRSAAAEFGARVLGVVLTGMGIDGRAGSKALFDAGAVVYAQDKKSSVVWGMPGAVVEAGLASRTGAPDDLAFHAARFARRAKTHARAEV
jgi:two-component system, chemotaxis family, protein-glutamate methylesterase/glutaminase